MDDNQQLAIFKACFAGLPNVYGTCDPGTGRVWQQKAPVTDGVLRLHLDGIRRMGTYLLTGETTRAVVADFDEQDTGPPLAFVRRAAELGLSAYLERSKGKGWHVWIFMAFGGASAAKSRSVVNAILDDIDAAGTEVFPKRDRLDADTQSGSFIFAPLYDVDDADGRTVFVDEDLEAYNDQWDFLAHVQRATDRQLDEVTSNN